MNDYWTECVAEALREAEIKATSKQILVMAEIIEGAHSVHQEAIDGPVGHGYWESKYKDTVRELEATRAKADLVADLKRRNTNLRDNYAALEETNERLVEALRKDRLKS